MTETVAIIGAGAGGLACGYFLHKDCDITVFEQEHEAPRQRRLMVDSGGRTLDLDTGFLVFNDRAFPNLARLLQRLQLSTESVPLSFSVRYDPLGLEYSGNGLSGLFSQPRNMFKPRFYRMLLAVQRFNTVAADALRDPATTNLSLIGFFRHHKIHVDALEQYLLPLASCIWPGNKADMMNFPARTLIEFFHNNGFLGTSPVSWQRVAGGSWRFREKLAAGFKKRIQYGEAARRVQPRADHVEVFTDCAQYRFDKVILACHADQALALLANPSKLEAQILSRFEYRDHEVLIHTDTAVMPQSKKAWSSWNARVPTGNGEQGPPLLTSHLNTWRDLAVDGDYFMSLNATGYVHPDKIISRFPCRQLVLSDKAVDAGRHLQALNRQPHPVYFCGGYFRDGTYEDGLSSAMVVSKKLLSWSKLW